MERSPLCHWMNMIILMWYLIKFLPKLMRNATIILHEFKTKRIKSTSYFEMNRDLALSARIMRRLMTALRIIIPVIKQDEHLQVTRLQWVYAPIARRYDSSCPSSYHTCLNIWSLLTYECNSQIVSDSQRCYRHKVSRMGAYRR